MKMKKGNKIDFEFLINYCKKFGAIVTVDRNPSPEKIASIKAQIEKNKQNELVAKNGRRASR